MRTTLYPYHLELGAKMGTFAGWEMPLWYQSATVEHLAVRHKAGLFDVSHMALFEVSDEKQLEWLTPTLFSNKLDGSVTYTLLMDENGGVKDDILVYKWSANRFWIVANAANREKVRAHLSKWMEVEEKEMAILALQGPETEKFHPIPHKMSFVTNSNGYVVSGTGYTGEKGIEIFLPPDQATALFRKWVEQGATPCGLAARDTLRLEKGFALWGHELSESIAPEESVAAWVLKNRDSPYLGQGGIKPRLHPVSFVLQEGIAREGAPLFLGEKEVGKVTSGTFSPCLKQGIGLGLVTDNPDHVMIRGKKMPLKLVTLPFV